MYLPLHDIIILRLYHHVYCQCAPKMLSVPRIYDTVRSNQKIENNQITVQIYLEGSQSLRQVIQEGPMS